MKYSTTIKPEVKTEKKELSDEDRDIYRQLLSEHKYDQDFLRLSREDQIKTLKLKFEIKKLNKGLEKLGIKKTNKPTTELEKELAKPFPSRVRVSKLSM